MKVLVLGGLSFLGRHLVERSIEHGHEVTTFTRGRQNVELYPEAEKLIGDRDGGLTSLEGRSWDVAIDTSGYVPRLVSDSARLLKNAVEHYTFISTLSVYADTSVLRQGEDAPVGTLDDPTVEEITGETYGPLKVLCEQAAEAEFPGRALIIRPGLIVGMYDPTDRFTYWPHRMARGGEVLAPNSPHDTIQIIDCRDLAEWTLRMADIRATGVFNATGPDYPLLIGDVLDLSKKITEASGFTTWVPAEFLAAHGVQPWSDMPAWFPLTGETAGFSTFDCSRAIAAGLTFRSLALTIEDTLAWDNTRPAGYELKAGISPEREREVLDAWHKQADG